MINSDDPRLTAYVLGELDDTDCKEVEAAIAASPELQAEVDSIRNATELFGTSLQAADSPALTDEQRAAIEEQSVAAPAELSSRSANVKRTFGRRLVIAFASTSLAGLLVIGFMLASVYTSHHSWRNVDELALKSAPQASAPSPDSLPSGHYLTDEVEYSDPAASSTQRQDSMLVRERDSFSEFREAADESIVMEEEVSEPLAFSPRAEWSDSGGYGSYRGGETANLPADMYGEAMAADPAPGGLDFVIPLPAEPLPAEMLENESRSDVASTREFGFDPLGDNASQPGRLNINTTSESDFSMPAGTSGRGLAESNAPRARPELMEVTPRIIIDEEEERLSIEATEDESATAQAARPHSAPVNGVPAIQLADGQEEPMLNQIEKGRLSGGRGLSADMSNARVRPGTSGEPQEATADLLAMLDDPNSSTGDAAARATVQNAESELTESVDINERSPNAIPDTQIRRQEVTVTRSEVEPRQDLSRMKRVVDPNELVGSKPATPTRTWRRAQATPNASRLVIGDRDELLLEGMQANVMVDGFRARVLLDLYYFNNRGRQLEGNFKLRLPNEASLYYFAFGESAYEYRPQVDQLASKGFLNGELVRAAGLSPKGILEAREGSWSKVKEARVVPREKAAHAYSETVRRRVDPALVEWSGAGMFNARVFPLMPNKLHRIVVGYDVDLQQVGDDFVYKLDLPKDVEQCMVDLNVSALPGTSAEMTPTTRPFVSGGRAYYHFDEVKDNSLELRFAGTGPVLLKGTDHGAGEFFAARVTPKLSDSETQASAERATFLVDTSLSSRPDKFNIWLNLLDETLTKNRDAMKKFSVLFFDVDSHWWKDAEVDNTAENVDALMKYCYTLSLEGATDMRQALHEAASPAWLKDDKSQRDLFLLSDGAATWGELNTHRMRAALKANHTLFAYKTGLTGTSTTTLESLARHTGGAVFSIVNEDEIAAAATAHRRRPWKLEDVTLAGGTDLLIAGRPEFIYPGQSLLVVGRGDPDAEVMMKVSRGEEVTQLSVPVERVVESDLAARAYGQVSVGQLEDLGSSLEDVSAAYARHFRITGQTCSLLMLESEADYKRFNIKPEDDVFVVRSTPSADLITKKLDELKEQLGDAKTQVVAWLDKLQNTAGFQFELPTALRLVIDRLPQSAFDVEPTRLNCKSRDRDSHTKQLIEQFDSGKLDYDTITTYAEEMAKQNSPADGLRSLSSLIEQNPGDPILTRDVAYAAIEWNLGGQAFPLLQRVASMRPYEPQSYIAMAQCLSDIGHADLAMVYYEVAVNASWNDRYKDIRDIASVEYLRLLRRINTGELSSHAPEYASARFESLSGKTPIKEADLVITMMWNTDRTDVDLHVLEPTGEECFYKHPTTRIGGHVTRDVTEGLGPEMYTLPKAKSGNYKIMANYFGSDANRTKVRTKVYITVYEDFGSKQESVAKKTITLSHQKEKRELTTVTVK